MCKIKINNSANQHLRAPEVQKSSKKSKSLLKIPGVRNVTLSSMLRTHKSVATCDPPHCHPALSAW